MALGQRYCCDAIKEMTSGRGLREIATVIAGLYVDMTQAKVTGEEGTITEKMPLRDWAVGKPVGCFLN